MLQNADVQRRLYERKSDDVAHRLRESEYSVTRYQVLSDVSSAQLLDTRYLVMCQVLSY